MTTRRRRAFTLIELLVVIAIIALLIGILLPSLGAARKAGRKVVCESHLAQLYVAHSTYWNDFDDRMASYTWEPLKSYSQWNDLNNAGSWTTAAANQAVDILRRLADRPDLPPIGDRLPHRHYSHLVLNEYLSHKLPEQSMACPEDRPLVRWQNDPKNLDDPRPLDWNTPFGRLWAYSSTYQIIPAAWSPDQGNNLTVRQYPNDHNLFWVAGKWGKRRGTDVAYPANKVGVFEFISRHGNKPLYHAYPYAVVPLMMWDGAVRSRKTGDANPGFDPWAPTSAAVTSYQYNPGLLGYEPPTASGAPFDTVVGYYRWTRGGLRGVDYAATEIKTGNP
ncbi:MAG: type II secretion system protein [Phycisphaerales bacterium]